MHISHNSICETSTMNWIASFSSVLKIDLIFSSGFILFYFFVQKKVDEAKAEYCIDILCMHEL